MYSANISINHSNIAFTKFSRILQDFLDHGDKLLTVMAWIS